MKDVRKKKGINQASIAGRMRISQGQLSKLESGHATLTLPQYVSFTRITGEVFGIEKKKTVTVH